MNLRLMLEKTASRFARNTAIVSGERRITYAELDEDSNKIANALIKLGVKKGDCVATILDTSPELACIYFGIVKAGGIAVLLDIRYKIEELASLFANCQPKVLMTESPCLEPLIPELPRFDSIKHVIDLSANHQGQFLSYQEIMSTSPAQKVDVELSLDDIATISYTGGPTIHPHGVALTQRSLIEEAISSAAGFEQTEKDKVMLFALPIYHMFGLASVLLTSVYVGSTIVIVPGTGRSISSLFETIEKEGGTIYLGVPYIYSLAINVAEHEGVKNDLSSLRLCGSGGAPLLLDVVREFKRHYGITILDIWGLTESVSHITCPPMRGPVKPGSCGKAIPGWELKIVAVDDGSKELPPGQSGEILVKGPFMKGYYNNPEDTARAIKEGWLHTGDIGKLDEDGYLYITGRKKNMIILKGQNVYPSDVEAVLQSHPKVAKARVVGIPDKLRGETVKAFIKLKEGIVATEPEIRHFCQGRMADYKWPREIVFSDSLPEIDAPRLFPENV